MTVKFRTFRRRTKVAMALSIVFLLVTVFSFTAVQHFYIDHYIIGIAGGGIDFYDVIFKVGSIEPSISFTTWSIRWLPEIENNPSSKFYNCTAFIPVWMVAPLVFIPTYLLWRKDRRTPKGHCKNCGYNLIGNVSGKCSECGQPISEVS